MRHIVPSCALVALWFQMPLADTFRLKPGHERDGNDGYAQCAKRFGQKTSNCGQCGGSGVLPPASCKTCEGKGAIVTERKCNTCMGSGKAHATPGFH